MDAENKEDKRHELEQFLLELVRRRRRRHAHLEIHRYTHDEREDVYGVAENQRQPWYDIRKRKVTDPQKVSKPQLRSGSEHEVKTQEDWQLHQ